MAQNGREKGGGRVAQLIKLWTRIKATILLYNFSVSLPISDSLR